MHHHTTALLLCALLLTGCQRGAPPASAPKPPVIPVSQPVEREVTDYVEFTRLTAPINGMVSRTFFTPGNLVTQDQTLLTTVVSLDPMYAYFDMDEPTLLSIRRAINEGRIKVPSDRSDIPILMGIQGED